MSILAKDPPIPMDNVRIGTNLRSSGDKLVMKCHASFRDVAGNDHRGGGLIAHCLFVTGREVGHIFDLIVERNRMAEKSSPIIIVNLGHQLLMDAWSLEHVS